MPLTEQDLIRIGTIESSTHPYVTAVRESLPRLDELLRGEYGVGIEHPQIDQFIGDLRTASTKGHGYVASSRYHGAQKELLWTSNAASTLQNNNNNNNVEPILIPVDTFFQYRPEEFDLTDKVHFFNPIYSPNKKKYFIVLSDFCSSQLFDEQTLTDMPSQEQLGMRLGSKSSNEYIVFSDPRNKFDEKIVSALRKSDGHVDKMLTDLQSQYSTVASNDVKLLVATKILNKMSNWQKLWYENSDGVPLYIVAPEAFHHAMNKIRMHDGHTPYEYQYRAQSLAKDFPILELVDGKIDSLYLNDDSNPYEKMGEQQRRFQALGITGAEFYRRFGKMIGL